MSLYFIEVLIYVSRKLTGGLVLKLLSFDSTNTLIFKHFHTYFLVAFVNIHLPFPSPNHLQLANIRGNTFMKNVKYIPNTLKTGALVCSSTGFQSDVACPSLFPINVIF